MDKKFIVNGEFWVGHLLSNEEIEIEISGVGEVYHRSRFDWTGFITQVRLKKGDHTFCVPESYIPGEGTEGIGFCNEFLPLLGVGYDNTIPGEKYPKIGVGLITRPDDSSYQPNNHYHVTAFITEVNVTKQSITFVSLPHDHGGCSFRLEKTITLNESSFTINYQLTNVGMVQIQTREYVHNFIGINHAPIGPEYVVQFPFPVTLYQPIPGTDTLLQISGNTVRWKSIPNETFFTYIKGYTEQQSPYYWELYNEALQVGVREKGDFSINQINLWGEDHVASVEILLDLVLEAGQTKNWSRTFEFFTRIGE